MENKNMSELKPCPFCQSNLLHTPSFDVQPDGIWQSHVECTNCEARGPNAYWHENDEEAARAAIAAWNAIAAQLAAPAAAQESVGMIDKDGSVILWANQVPHGSMLYAAPQGAAHD